MHDRRSATDSCRLALCVEPNMLVGVDDRHRTLRTNNVGRASELGELEGNQQADRTTSDTVREFMIRFDITLKQESRT